MIFTPAHQRGRRAVLAGHPAARDDAPRSCSAQSTGSLFVKNNIADLTLNAALAISGTLSEPRLDGQIMMEEGGRIFAARLPLHRSTPTAAASASRRRRRSPTRRRRSICYADGGLHRQLRAAAHAHHDADRARRCRRASTSARLDGWSRNQVLSVLFVGQSPDDIRRITQGKRRRRRRPAASAAPPTRWPRRSPAPRSASSSRIR